MQDNWTEMRTDIIILEVILNANKTQDDVCVSFGYHDMPASVLRSRVGMLVFIRYRHGCWIGSKSMTLSGCDVLLGERADCCGTGILKLILASCSMLCTLKRRWLQGIDEYQDVESFYPVPTDIHFFG